MTHKSTTLLALIIAIHTMATCAMEKQSNHIIKTVNVRIANHTPEPFKVPLKISVSTPASAVTLEEKNAYYQTVKTEVHAKLMKVLVAYETAQEDIAIGNHFVTLKPTELFYVPASNRFVLRRNWKTHKITDSFTALLETRMECIFDQGKLTPRDPMLHMTNKETKAKESISMNALFTMFPDKSLLNLNPTNAHENAKKVMAMSLERVRGLMNGENSSTIPDVDRFTHDLYLADIKTMVAYYLATKEKPTVN